MAEGMRGEVVGIGLFVATGAVFGGLESLTELSETVDLTRTSFASDSDTSTVGELGELGFILLSSGFGCGCGWIRVFL